VVRGDEIDSYNVRVYVVQFGVGIMVKLLCIPYVSSTDELRTTFN